MAKVVVITKGLTALSHELGDNWVTIGRADDNSFQLADSTVSGRHCEVLLRGGELVVRDLHSTNGTFVNGKRVFEAVMTPEQTLQLGEVELRFEAPPLSDPVVASTNAVSVSPDAESSPKIKVLFVDDSQIFLETFTELCVALSRQTWCVECATAVDDALAALQASSFDLVVLDVGMPMVDGLQLLGILHRRHPEMKIAVMTGSASESKRADALANGAELFVEKPVTPEGIKSVFNRLNDLAACSQRTASSDSIRLPGGSEIIQAPYAGEKSGAPEIKALAEPSTSPPPEKSVEPASPDEEFVVVATYDGKWISVDQQKK